VDPPSPSDANLEMDGSLGAATMACLCVAFGAAALARRHERRVRVVVAALSPSSVGESGRTAVLLTRVGRWRLRSRPLPAGLERRLSLSGVPWSAEWLVGLKVAGAAGGAVVGMALTWMAPPAAPLLGLLAVMGYRAPDLVLARRGRHRQRAIELHVPDLVELLVATTEAGLAPSIALRRSASVVGGPLGQELSLATSEIDLGVPWATAMDHLVHRTDVPSLHRLVAALSRSNRLGTSVRSTLRSVAGDLRAERRVHAEETARRAPVKMLFPLVFLILPAFLLLTVGPVVLATVQSLRSGG